LDPFPIDRLAASPTPSVGGLGLIALGVLLALFLSDVWVLMLVSVAGGAALAVTIATLRRRTDPRFHASVALPPDRWL
jgi:hypothetical protein